MNRYTKENMETLKKMTPETTPVHVALLEFDCDPNEFNKWLSQLPKEYEFVYEIDNEDLPLKVNDPSISGFLEWRLKIGK